MEDYEISKVMPTSGKFVRIHQYGNNVWATPFKWENGVLLGYDAREDEWNVNNVDAVKRAVNITDVVYVIPQKRGAWIKFNEKMHVVNALEDSGKDDPNVPSDYVWCEEVE